MQKVVASLLITPVLSQLSLERDVVHTRQLNPRLALRILAASTTNFFSNVLARLASNQLWIGSHATAKFAQLAHEGQGLKNEHLDGSEAVNG